MKYEKLKLIFVSLIFCSILSLGLNSNAKNKWKQIDSLKVEDLEKFLTLKHDYLKIPITKKASGHLHVDVVLNGVEGEFILDTGAGKTVVDSEKINSFYLQTNETNAIGSGAGGTLQFQIAKNNIIKLGGVTKREFDVYIMDLSHVNKGLTSMGQKGVDGIIGADVLTENKAVIDYSNLVLYLIK